MSIRATLVSACLIALAFTSAGAASAAATDSSTSDASSAATTDSGTFTRSSISSWLTDNGVKPAVAEKLMKKWDAGQKWDSADSKKAISSTTSNTNGYQVTRSVFPDGSITVASTQSPATAPASSGGGVSTQSISSCQGRATSKNGGSWEQCKSTIKSGNAIVSFRFNYNTPDGGGYGSITYAGDGVISGICNIDSTNVSVPIKKASSSQSARASHSWNTHCGGAFSTSGYQTVLLSGGGVLREDWSF